MSTTVETNKVTFTGNGSTVDFAFTFRVFADTDLEVYLDGVLKTLTTHYTVSIDPSVEGGTVTFVTAPASSVAVLIKRVLDYTQPSDIPTESNFPEATIENALDRATMLIVQLKEILSRCPALAITSSFSDLTLPEPSAGKVIGWNDAADDLENLTLEQTTVAYSGTISKGVDASKPASPSQGDIYLATDTGKIYVCLSGGSWTFYDPSGIYSIAGLTEKTTPASDDVFVIEDSAASNAKKKIKYSSLGLPKDYISGGIISNNSGDVTNDLDISAVECRSDDDSDDIVVSALTKRIDATFVAGTNQGFLDTGTIGASEDLVYIYAIKNPSSGATDFLASKSPTAPTMPSGYTKKRRLGGRRWDGAAWALFSSFGDGRVVDVWYQKSDDADHNVLSAGTQTTFTDVDCGDGGAEVIPTGGFFAYLAIHNRSNSVTSVASYIRRNGDTGATDQGNIAAYNEPTNATPRHSTMGEIYVDSDGIFEYATIASSELYLYVRGYREVR